MLYDRVLIKYSDQKSGRVENNTELEQRWYESAVLMLNAQSNQILLVKEATRTSSTESWMLPSKNLTKETETSRNCAVLAAQGVGLSIHQDELEVLAYYYPSINYDYSKHAVFMVKSACTGTEEFADSGKNAKWFTFSEIDTMIEQGGINDGRTMIAFYKLMHKNRFFYKVV